MPRPTAGTPKRPAHEVLLGELEQTLKERRSTYHQDAQLLVRVIGQCIIPPKSIPDVVRRLESIQSGDTRIIGIGSILLTLRAEYQEHVR